MLETARSRTEGNLAQAPMQRIAGWRRWRGRRAAWLGATALLLVPLTGRGAEPGAPRSGDFSRQRRFVKRMAARLAPHAGILPSYTSDRGKEVHTRPIQVLRYLRRQGFEVRNAAGLRGTLAALKSERYRTLPPVLVVQREGSTGSLEVEVEVGLPPGETPEGKTFLLTPEGSAGAEATRLAASSVDPVVRGKVGARAQGKGVDGQERALWKVRLALPEALPWGYHTLALSEGEAAPMSLIVAPTRMPEPPGKTWGVNLNVGGMENYTKAAELVRWLGAQGAAFVVASPLFHTDPGALLTYPNIDDKLSPYAPGTTVAHNPWLIDPAPIARAQGCAVPKPAQVETPSARAAREAGREGGPAVALAQRWAILRGQLEGLYENFRSEHLQHNTPEARAFAAFREQRGAAKLRAFALNGALSAYFREKDANDHWGWPVWPEAYRNPASSEVQAFAAKHEQQIGFHEYVAWRAAQQVAALERAALDAGMFGVVRDTPVGVVPDGSDGWTNSGYFARGYQAGAPPDSGAPLGQGWGSMVLEPRALRAAAYVPWIERVRSMFEGGAAARVDHGFLVQRIFAVPVGAPARKGIYLGYRPEDTLAILALEMARAKAPFAVLEDLGTRPEGLAELMRRFATQGMDVFKWSGRADDGTFLPPAEGRREQAMLVLSSLDIGSLAAWWSGRDIDVAYERGRYGTNTNARDADRTARRRECEQMVEALVRFQNTRPDEPALQPLVTARGEQRAPTEAEIVPAMLAFFGATAPKMLVINAADLLSAADVPNVPGTLHADNFTGPEPSAQGLSASSAVANNLEVLNRLRPRPQPPGAASQGSGADAAR